MNLADVKVSDNFKDIIAFASNERKLHLCVENN